MLVGGVKSTGKFPTLQFCNLSKLLVFSTSEQPSNKIGTYGKKITKGLLMNELKTATLKIENVNTINQQNHFGENIESNYISLTLYH